MLKRLGIDDVRAMGDDHHLGLSSDEAEVLTATLLDAVSGFEELEDLEFDEELPLTESRAVHDPGRRPSSEEDPFNVFITMCDVRGAAAGLLEGRTVGLKDNIAVAGVPMTLGTRMLEGYIPDFDATVTSRLLDAGARIVGKTNMDGFSFGGYGWGGMGDFGRTLNPADEAALTGGSSQGSAAAVASGAVDLAFGGDQGGSIRLPAAACGVVGLKATHGLIPHSGVFGLDPVIDYTGPIAKTVREVASVLSVVAGRDPFDPRQRDVPFDLPDYSAAAGRGVVGLRVGVLDEAFEPSVCDEEVADSIRGALAVLAEEGAVISNVSVPLHDLATVPLNALWAEGMRRTLDTNLGGAFANSYYPTSLMTAIGRAKVTNGHELPLNVKRLLLTGEYLNRYYQGRFYARAQNMKRRFIAAYDRAFDEVDVLVTPTSSVPVPDYHQPGSVRDGVEQTLFGGNAPDLKTIIRNTVPFNYTGHPAMSVPCGLADGRPVGIQFVAARFRDETLIQVGVAYQEARGRASVNDDV